MVNFIAQAILRSLNVYLDVFTPVDKKEQWISLAEASKYCSYSQAYLGKLAKERRIDAHKDGRNWVTTRKVVEQYSKNNGTK